MLVQKQLIKNEAKYTRTHRQMPNGKQKSMPQEYDDTWGWSYTQSADVKAMYADDKNWYETRRARFPNGDPNQQYRPHEPLEFGVRFAPGHRPHMYQYLYDRDRIEVRMLMASERTRDARMKMEREREIVQTTKSLHNVRSFLSGLPDRYEEARRSLEYYRIRAVDPLNKTREAHIANMIRVAESEVEAIPVKYSESLKRYNELLNAARALGMAIPEDPLPQPGFVVPGAAPAAQQAPPLPRLAPALGNLPPLVPEPLGAPVPLPPPASSSRPPHRSVAGSMYTPAAGYYPRDPTDPVTRQMLTQYALDYARAATAGLPVPREPRVVTVSIAKPGDMIPSRVEYYQYP